MDYFLLIVQCTNVLSLIFLKTRAFVPELSSSAWLVSSDTEGKLVLAMNIQFTYAICRTYFISFKGYVHFWSVLNGGKFITSFQAVSSIFVYLVYHLSSSLIINSMSTE